MSKKNTEKAANTGSIWFYQRVKHRSEEIAIQMPVEAAEILFEFEN